MADQTKTQAAWADMVDALGQVSERFCGEEWGVSGEQDIADSHRLVLHILQSALFAHAEFDPERPVWRRIVSPTRKFTGDNADAVYFEAPVRSDLIYRVSGNLAGAVYTSFTVELGTSEGRYATGTGGVLNDDDIDVDADGNYEVLLGGEPRDRNWLDLPPDAGRITTRHYFEVPKPSAADESLHIPLAIECLSPVGPATLWNDETVAAAIGRVSNHVLGKTLQQPIPGTYPLPSWVSREPNVLPDPQPPGTMGFAAFDAYYTMGRYVLAPDEALVMTGRWPECKFGNVCLWTAAGQTYDYGNRTTSRNRANTTLEADGTFKMVIAHEDPGVYNWLDTEGRPSGSIFWRFFLPTGSVERIEPELVKLADLR